ncbi:GNAT family N-acetyltransferase [Bacillus sp. MUM 116]|uniref:GNAT family N-acetyltransferase n=1 Tax=Bacillus sp. MUM 116 TaxID=1678002 RepID=UPI0008F5DBEE|nr:GNAT family N-acetyltransferase [Bacillus sp. MUM 116]OIK15629.1 GNAT family N-acetyltransferase [Bacillus sp. MUM 116]
MSIWEKDGFFICIDKQYLDLPRIHQFLSEESYWVPGISFEVVKKSIENSSICFGVYEGNPVEGNADQVGFARTVSDFYRFGWIMDVFILEEYRGKGLSKWLMEIVTEQSELRNVAKLMLATNDAHGLYTQYGFKKIENRDLYMERKK